MKTHHLAQRQHAWLNLVHTWLLVGGSLALFVACAWLFFGPGGIWYALVFGGVSLFMASRVSPTLVLRMYKAQPVSPQQFPQGHKLLDQLSERAGLNAKPKLYVLPSKLMNAFAVGRKRDSAICLTDRLIRSLTLRELAGVMAHEVAHIRAEDVRVMAIADMVSRFTSVLSTLGIFSLFINLPAILFGGAAQVPWLAVLLLIFAPTIGSLLQLALSRTREYDADLNAVLLTGDPDGLASALVKLEKAQGRHWEGMVLPGGRTPDPSILRTHPRTEDRVARLMALKDMAVSENLPPPPRTQPVPPMRRGGSPVPQVKPKWGRQGERRYRDYASLLGSGIVQPLHPAEHGDNEPEELPRECKTRNPRPHLRGLGVYW